MKTDRSFTTKTLYSQLDYYKVLDPSSKTSFYSWLTVTITTLFLLFSGFFMLHKQKIRDLALLTKKEVNATSDNEELKENLHAYHAVKDANNDLKNRMTQLNTHNQSSSSTPILLKSISLSIREQTWITQLKVSAQKNSKTKLTQTTKTKHSSFSICAQTFNDQEITPFTSALTQITSISQVKVNRILRITPDHSSSSLPCLNPYTQFHVSGKIDPSLGDNLPSQSNQAEKASS